MTRCSVVLEPPSRGLLSAYCVGALDDCLQPLVSEKKKWDLEHLPSDAGAERLLAVNNEISRIVRDLVEQEAPAKRALLVQQAERMRRLVQTIYFLGGPLRDGSGMADEYLHDYRYPPGSANTTNPLICSVSSGA